MEMIQQDSINLSPEDSLHINEDSLKVLHSVRSLPADQSFFDKVRKSDIVQRLSSSAKKRFQEQQQYTTLNTANAPQSSATLRDNTTSNWNS
jgi:hypothetical protein